MLNRALRAAVAAVPFLMLASLPASAMPMISAGIQTTTVPTALFDPLSSLFSPLPAGQFLLPVEITGATGLQDWSFDLTFNESVVNLLDVGGLYQSVYQTEFNSTDMTLSNITSSGLPGMDVLEGIAGFSSGVSGDGTLAYILFEYAQGQENNDPGFGIENPTISQAPEPETLALLASGLVGLLCVRRRSRSRDRHRF
jgi:hypothetical protein